MSAAPQLALWCSRACDGINREWVGGARGRHPVHGDVSHFLRLSAWRVALEMRDRPVALVLTRQDVPTLDRGQYASAEGLRRGAYVLVMFPMANRTSS